MKLKLYSNSSMTSEVRYVDYLSGDGVDYGYYLEPGTYYVYAYGGRLGLSFFPYYVPVSKLISASYKVNGGNATISIKTAMKNASFRWAFDALPSSSVTRAANYPNSELSEEFIVKENGTYSIRAAATKGEWAKFPVEVQVEVEGIVDNPFKDVDNNKWYAPAVKYVYSNGIMSGTKPDTFLPNANCTRAMMVTILYNAAGKVDADANIKFVDVPKNSWYTKPVSWAVYNGITNGIDATHFGPEGNVTREQVAKFLFDYARYQGKSTSYYDNTGSFEDANQISSWARKPMAWANYNKIINGNGAGLLNPRGYATRAEIAQMIMGYNQKFNK